MAFTGHCVVPTIQEQTNLLAATDELALPNIADCLESADYRSIVENRPNPDRRAYSLERAEPKRAKTKQITHQTPRRICNHNLVRLGSAEQAGSKVGRLANDVDFAGYVLAHDVTNHDWSGRDTDPSCKRAPLGAQRFDCGNSLEA